MNASAPAPREPAAAANSVSVVLCAYNGVRFLPEQLDSLLAQTRRPDRIVLADDASTDATWALLQAFAERAGALGVQVETHRNPANLGYLRNFESALQRAGEGIVFLSDQDDVWHPDKIERFLEQFQRRPSLGLLHSDSRLVDADGADLGERMFGILGVSAGELEALHGGRGFEVLVRRNIVTGATMAVRQELLRHVFPIPANWVHDEWIALLASAIGEIDSLESPSIDYRQHGANQIGARRRTLAERLGGSRERLQQMQGLVGKFETLCAFIERHDPPIPADKRAVIVERLNHLRLRLAMPGNPLRRLPLVLEEWRHGRYRRFASGTRSLVCDVLGLR
ncbi:glycosyltransferase family 2 protein [Pseudomonas sp. CGJS7]|uniref:glycosyltransferase family 2 protein n=1 Tax=Pseudomonas sp. CGJS7 TaxID=3109348 RepID=UPI003008F625